MGFAKLTALPISRTVIEILLRNANILSSVTATENNDRLVDTLSIALQNRYIALTRSE